MPNNHLVLDQKRERWRQIFENMPRGPNLSSSSLAQRSKEKKPPPSKKRRWDEQSSPPAQKKKKSTPFVYGQRKPAAKKKYLKTLQDEIDAIKERYGKSRLERVRRQAIKNARKEHDEETNLVVQQLPVENTSVFGEIGFGKYQKRWFPVLIVSPYDVALKSVRSKWYGTFKSVSQKSNYSWQASWNLGTHQHAIQRNSKAPHLGYWIGGNDYTAISHSKFVRTLSGEPRRHFDSVQKRFKEGAAFGENGQDAHTYRSLQDFERLMKLKSEERRRAIPHTRHCFENMSIDEVLEDMLKRDLTVEILEQNLSDDEGLNDEMENLKGPKTESGLKTTPHPNLGPASDDSVLRATVTMEENSKGPKTEPGLKTSRWGPTITDSVLRTTAMADGDEKTGETAIRRLVKSSPTSLADHGPAPHTTAPARDDGQRFMLHTDTASDPTLQRESLTDHGPAPVTENHKISMPPPHNASGQTLRIGSLADRGSTPVTQNHQIPVPSSHNASGPTLQIGNLTDHGPATVTENHQISVPSPHTASDPTLPTRETLTDHGPAQDSVIRVAENHQRSAPSSDTAFGPTLPRENLDGHGLARHATTPESEIRHQRSTPSSDNSSVDPPQDTTTADLHFEIGYGKPEAEVAMRKWLDTYQLPQSTGDFLRRLGARTIEDVCILVRHHPEVLGPIPFLDKVKLENLVSSGGRIKHEESGK
eukprot:scaffold4510_cov183-Amphora_coffeaeformis.AAC.117